MVLATDPAQGSRLFPQRRQNGAIVFRKVKLRSTKEKFCCLIVAKYEGQAHKPADKILISTSSV